MSNDFFPSLMQFIYVIPTLLVCAIGILILSMRAMPKKARIAGIAGLAITALLSVIGVAFNVYVQTMYASEGYTSENINAMHIGYSIFSTLGHLLAMTLLIVAICIRDTSTPEKNSVKNPYELP
jgi:heme/copper-type cytochrome/quinol oxidase subunit 3